MTDAPHVPPQALEAEESVLGAMLLSPGAIGAVTEILSAEDFYRESHGTIYRACLGLYQQGEPVDAITVVAELEKRGELEQVGDRSRIHELAALVPATSNAAHYARIVREMATRRGLIRAGVEIARAGMEGGEIPDLLERAERAVFGLTQEGLQSGLAPVRVALQDTFAHMTALAEGRTDLLGVPSGFKVLDDLTLGFQPGNLVILAARPSMGKSALALGVAAHVSLRARLPVAMFSLEMPGREVVQRLLAMESNVDLRRVRSGRADPAEWGRLGTSGDRLDKAPFWLEDNSSLSMVEVRSQARRLKAQQPELALIVVDYLGLLVRGKHEHKTAETGAIALQLKQLAKDLDLPVLCLCQLNRGVEGRNDKRPGLSDLRDSGEIEQHADLVCLLYRDDYYNPETSDSPGIAEVIVAKHRNGPTDTVKLTWLKQRAKFSPLAAVA